MLIYILTRWVCCGGLATHTGGGEEVAWPGCEVKASHRFRPQPPQLYQSQCQSQHHQSVRLADIVIKDQFGNSLLTDIKSEERRFSSYQGRRGTCCRVQSNEEGVVED